MAVIVISDNKTWFSSRFIFDELINQVIKENILDKKLIEFLHQGQNFDIINLSIPHVPKSARTAIKNTVDRFLYTPYNPTIEWEIERGLNEQQKDGFIQIMLNLSDLLSSE